jgi:hypothetical protein
MHGASTGPRTAEGLERSRRARWKHALYSAEALAEQKRVRELAGPKSRALETDASRLNRTVSRCTGFIPQFGQFTESRSRKSGPSGAAATNENAPDSLESLRRSLNSPPPKSAHN